MTAHVLSINLSEKKTVKKTPQQTATLIFDRGFAGDAHSGDWHRQVSMLAIESIKKMCDKGLDVGPGDFAENITCEGIDLMSLPIGTVLRIGEAVLELSQIGKICHTKCAIFYAAGDCVMPKEGVFFVVRTPATVSVGDSIEIISRGNGVCEANYQEVHPSIAGNAIADDTTISGEGDVR